MVGSYLSLTSMTNAKYLGLFFALALLPISALAQVDAVLHGLVLDSLSSAPIAGVHVRLVRTSTLDEVRMAVTNKQGIFRIEAPKAKGYALQLGHVGYVPKRVAIPQGQGSDTLRIRLSSKVYTIPEVVIGRNAPEVVYQRKELHVGDHYATREGVWVLAYEQPRMWHREENAGEQLFRNARLVLLDTLFNEVASYKLPGEVRCLHHDHRGRVVVDGQRDAWVAELRNGEIAMGIVDRKTLHTAILPWTDSTAGRLLGTNRSEEWPAFDHLAFDPESDLQQAFCTIEDEHVMELFRSQYKYMSGRDKVIAMDLEKDTGIDKQVIAGYMTGFQHHPYFSVPYAPLFVVNDTLCVFDHVRQQIRRFTPAGEGIDEVPMQHANDRRWRGRLIQDRADLKVYALFARGSSTWLCRVEPSTGLLGAPASLAHPFPEEVQIHGGYAYYVYRPTGPRDQRTLYREAVRQGP